MKFTKKLLTLFLPSLLVIPAANSQCKVRATEKADFAYESNAFFTAVDLYKKAKGKLKKDKAAKICVQYQIARCYLKMQEFKKAESQLKSLLKNDDIDPSVYLDYGNMLKMQGRYEEAKTQFQTYKEKNPSDPRGDLGITSCDMAIKWIADPTCYQVENVKDWNTKERDYAATYASKKLNQVIFSSNRVKSEGKDNAIAGELFEDLYTSTKDRSGKWSTPATLGSMINGKFSEGPSVMDGKFRVLYFTRCVSDKKEGSFCQIYKTQRSGDTWSEPEKLTFVSDSFATGHPTLTADGKIMIFSSNMTGGYGMQDLWYATYDKKKKDFQNPVNLGPEINTADNEMFPFLKSDGTLYFSSDTMSGMGGLDIYKAKSTGENTWGNPENMQFPINSEGDDFGIVFEPAAETGYLTSNREGGKGSDDIYAFKIPTATITLSGTVRDKDTKEVIPGATIELKDATGAAINITTDATGFYKKDIPFGVSYDMTASAKDYFNDVNRASSLGLDPLINCKDTNIVADFYLKTHNVVLEYEIQFIFDKCQWFEEYNDTLKKIITIMADNPNLVVEIGAHTDSRGSAEYNEKLAKCRAAEIVAYLEEQGIVKERMEAKGYGESTPRELQRDMVGAESGYVFKKGTVLTEEYINKLKETDGEKVFEDAHRLNRRVTVKKISDDFKPVTDVEEPE